MTEFQVKPTPYLELNEVLGELVARLEKTLGNKLVGIYLQGSFALGDFDEHSKVASMGNEPEFNPAEGHR